MHLSFKSALIAFLFPILVLTFQNCGQSGSLEMLTPSSQQNAQCADCNNETPPDGNPGGPNPPVVPPPVVPPPVLPPPNHVMSLVLTATPMIVVDGQRTELKVVHAGLNRISYKCIESTVTGVEPYSRSHYSGDFNLTTNVVSHVIDRDLLCEATGSNTTYPALAPIKSTVQVQVNCGNRLKENGRCVDFKCISVVELSEAQLLDVPARTANGACYAYKIMSSIARSAASLTPDKDDEIISRNHDLEDYKVYNTHNPYLMRKKALRFKILGARSLRLSGGFNQTSQALLPILVDNFILTGIFPVSAQPAAGFTPDELKTYYRVNGTTDSTIADENRNDTGAIKFKGTLLPLKSFGASGTSTVAPLDITNFVNPNIDYSLDARALDCGQTRHLSDIYLLFQ